VARDAGIFAASLFFVGSLLLIFAVGLSEKVITERDWLEADGLVSRDLGEDGVMIRFVDARERRWELASDERHSVEASVLVRYAPDDPTEFVIGGEVGPSVKSSSRRRSFCCMPSHW
jgi:hypothetical protein